MRNIRENRIMNNEESFRRERCSLYIHKNVFTHSSLENHLCKLTYSITPESGWNVIKVVKANRKGLTIYDCNTPKQTLVSNTSITPPYIKRIKLSYAVRTKKWSL